MKYRTKNRYHRIAVMLLPATLALLVLTGPAATQLQMRSHRATDTGTIDIVYLVCGARAQQRRLQAMEQWLQQHDTPPIGIWIGNDTQNSLWSRKHQRNLTRAEWAYEHATKIPGNHRVQIAPGSFTNTDGEMQALAKTLRNAPNMQGIAIVTCGFHARRSLARLQQYTGASIQISVIPVLHHWENRAPWIVLAEWLKILRDTLDLAQHPWFSRQP